MISKLKWQDYEADGTSSHNSYNLNGFWGTVPAEVLYRLVQKREE